MLVRRVNGCSPLALLDRDVDSIFSDFFGAPFGSLAVSGTSGVVPALNVREDEGHVYVEAEVPGLKLDDLQLELVEQELTITGERKHEKEEKDRKGYHVIERRYGKFSRTVSLPALIDATNADAALKDGILTVTLPKHEAVRSRKIQVKAAK